MIIPLLQEALRKACSPGGMDRSARGVVARALVPVTLLAVALAVSACSAPPDPETGTVRIMTYNIEDTRTDDLSRHDHPRLRRLAATIQRLRPDIVLINEIAYDGPGAPGLVDGIDPGSNGRRLAERFLQVAQSDDLEGVRYRAFMAPSNTGLSSGFDLNRNGVAVSSWPEPPGAAPDGSPAPQTAEGRAYGDDSWGFGTFPGQYAMALLVREDHAIQSDGIRTFQTFPWSAMPDARRPVDPASGDPWYDDEVWADFPLSSKSHWDVPVSVRGHVIHILASHPTPAAFDGPEQRNKLRNHDEIRFWSEYLDGAAFIRDDAGHTGGLPPTESFVIVGDLNADPDEGNAIDDPVGRWLLSHERVNGSFVPTADSAGIGAFPRLDPDDTARWGMRVDYVLPSMDLEIVRGAIERPADPDAPAVSDHFAVWIDVKLPSLNHQ